MRIMRLGSLLAFSLLSFAAAIQAQQPLTPIPTARDPHALSVLGRCLAAAGGAQAILAIQDFTGTGNVTYFYAGQDITGSVTVRGRGLTQFRVDATLPDGVHSWIVSKGAAFQKDPDGSIAPLPSQNAVKPAGITFPLPYLLSVLQDASISVSYGGLVTHDGAQVYDIVVQKMLSQTADPLNTVGNATKAHFFIDPNSLLVQSVQDMAYRKDGGPGEGSHEIQFSGYKATNGVLVPFSITEFVAGQKTAAIQLNQVTFSGGLTDSDFE
ncbi:MAG TPA: hypothetical protein VJN90_07125 [Candidatus Acidoferrales bacterium]|nr:hypothetical protein [Candidatus Acidoferrales bacterium]